MTRASLLALSATLMASVASSAFANTGANWPHWYVGLSGGVQFLRDSDIKGAPGSVTYDDGAVFTGSLGYQPDFGSVFFNGFRFEGELGYHYAGLDKLKVSGVTSGLNGHTAAWSYMGNVYYDIRTGGKWTPYLGAGLGGAQVKLSHNAGTLGNTSERDTVFAYQFMAGIGYSPESIPLTQWTLGYRYFAADQPEFGTAAGKVALDNYDAHNVELGAKFRF
jgi:opacity protein-like surface antigen